MFLGPRIEIQVSQLPGRGMNHAGAKAGLYFSSSVSTATQASGRKTKRPVGHDRLHSSSLPGFLTSSKPQHSLLPNGIRGITVHDPHGFTLEKDLTGTITSLYMSKRSWELNQQLWRQLGESWTGTMPPLSVAQILALAAAL